MADYVKTSRLVHNTQEVQILNFLRKNLKNLKLNMPYGN